MADALQLGADQRTALIAAATQPEGDPLALSAHSSATTPQSSARPVAEPSPGPGPGGSFVGRQNERRTLHDAWSRRARVALLFGEAGVGKSTLAEEFAAELAALHVTVFRGRSTPEQLGAYEAFVEPVRSALGRFDGNVPTTYRDLGRLVPGLIEAGGDDLIPSRSDPAVERRLLFETVCALMASTGPTLLLLDDLHWADPGTLAMLSFLVRQSSSPGSTSQTSQTSYPRWLVRPSPRR